MSHHFYETCAYFTAARYMRTAEAAANEFFKPTGMRPAYAYLMMALEDQHPQTISQLSENLGYERSSIYRMVQKLEKNGYLKMYLDGKSSTVDLLPASTPFLKTANQCLAAWGEFTSIKLGADKAAMTSLLTTNDKKLRG
ncbi:MarR family winged helix-turn-helix transcriptional regulator [Levilactobacillus yonginensis]